MTRKRLGFTTNRRELLTLAWVGALAAATWQFSKLFVRMANPHGLDSLLGGLVSLGAASAAPDVGDAPLDDPNHRLFLVNTPQGLLALDKTCTHLDCLLAWDGQSGEFFCPCHGSRFAQDGAYLEGPAPRAMDRYDVQAIDGESGEAGSHTEMKENSNAVLWVDTSQKTPGAPAA